MSVHVKPELVAHSEGPRAQEHVLWEKSMVMIKKRKNYSGYKAQKEV